MAGFVVGLTVGSLAARLFPGWLRKAQDKGMRAKLRRFGQGHLLANWESLSEDERGELVHDIKEFDISYVNDIFYSSMNTHEDCISGLSPMENVTTLKGTERPLRMKWKSKGLELISMGKVGILLLAGGQGTRLGSSEPKGCIDVGLPSGKSLFQLQAERILKLQQLAADQAFGPGSAVRHPLRWYIMTSPFTDADTKKHFQKHDYFGLSSDQIIFFKQGFLPCMTLDGKIIMQTESKIAKAPDGNGGLYLALEKSGCLADMRRHGVECVDCFCVDNLLAKIGDPAFVGHCWEKGAECGARVLKKRDESEKVGVFASIDGAAQVVEYSELPKDAAEGKDASGDFLYPWGNICMHYFTVSFLEQVNAKLRKAAKYHIAHKKIPSKDGEVKGIKLELFIFDTFPFASHVALFEVDRLEQFAPVKNAEGADSPQSAKDLLSSLHKKWIKEAGGKVDVKGCLEVDPSVSYDGEGLEACRGREISGGSLLVDQGYLQTLEGSRRGKR